MSRHIILQGLGLDNVQWESNAYIMLFARICRYEIMRGIGKKNTTYASNPWVLARSM